MKFHSENCVTRTVSFRHKRIHGSLQTPSKLETHSTKTRQEFVLEYSRKTYSLCFVFVLSLEMFF